MTIDTDPVIGKIGSFEFHWYGVIMAVAVMAGGVVLAWQLRRRGIRADHALGIAIFAIPLAVIGARLYHVLDNIGFYWHHPGDIFSGPLVGLAIYGVLTGALCGLVIYCRWKKLPVPKVLDSIALAFPVGQFIGKFANLINGDTWGYPTSLPWGIKYTNPHAFLPADLRGVPTHPTSIYEQVWILVVLGVLWYALPRLKTPGVVLVLYLALYSVGRFFLSYFRVNNVIGLGLREAQIVSLVVIVLALPCIYLLRRHAARASNAGSDSSALDSPGESVRGHLHLIDNS